MKFRGSSFIAGVVVGAALLLMTAYSVHSFTSTITQLYKTSVDVQAKSIKLQAMLRVTRATLDLTNMKLEVVVLNDGPESLPSVSLLELVVTISINGRLYTYMLKYSDELTAGCWIVNAILINDQEMPYNGARPLRPGEGLLITAQLPLTSKANISYGFVTLIASNSKAERVLRITGQEA